MGKTEIQHVPATDECEGHFVHPPPPERHSPEKIIEILRSITKLEITKTGELDTWFDVSYPESINSFVPGSFTRELLELIESHLL